MVAIDRVAREDLSDLSDEGNASRKHGEEKCVHPAEGSASGFSVSTLYFVDEKCIYPKE